MVGVLCKRLGNAIKEDASAKTGRTVRRGDAYPTARA